MTARSYRSTLPFHCSADHARHIAVIEEFLAAGYERVYMHHVEPDREGFIRFYQDEVLPALLSRL
jgi:hypothetical protein